VPKPPTASLTSPVPERRSCRTSGTHGARRIHRLSPRHPVRGVLSRRPSFSSVGRTPKPRPRYPPRSRTCSPSSLVATAPTRGDRSAVEARGSSSTSKHLGGCGVLLATWACSAQDWPCKSNPVRLGSCVSRALARREIASSRPGFWPQGQLRDPSSLGVRARLGPGESAVPQDRGYTAISALALAVEAAEALALSSPTVTTGLTAAGRPIERAAL
jgi:hypothetical protein